DLELALDPLLQVPAAPAHDTVPRQVRTALHPFHHLGFLVGREARFRTGRRPVGKPGDPLGVVVLLRGSLPRARWHCRRAPIQAANMFVCQAAEGLAFLEHLLKARLPPVGVLEALADTEHWLNWTRH